MDRRERVYSNQLLNPLQRAQAKAQAKLLTKRSPDSKELLPRRGLTLRRRCHGASDNSVLEGKSDTNPGVGI